MLLPLLVACVPDKDDAAGPADGSPTYYADVRPILDLNCARCHATGGVAPSFDEADDVVVRAAMIADYVEQGLMPLPAPDPTCRDYVDSERLVLSDENKAVLRAWADAGAPLGDPGDAPARISPLTTAPFDATIAAAAPYAPTFGNDGNAYRCFTVPLGNAADVFLTGMEAVIDNTAIVHHIVLARDTLGTSPTDAEGYACSGLGEPGWDFLGAWGPGGTPTTFPEGLGLRLPADARLVVQMHYYGDGDAGDDQTAVGLHLADSVEHEVSLEILGPTGFTVPAGEAAHTESESYSPGFGVEDYTLLGIWPHMHVLGKAFEAVVTDRDGEEHCIVREQQYDFENQVMVALKEPYVFESGRDDLRISCTWDNSAGNPNQLHDPPQDIPFGEETGAEMCFAFTYGYSPSAQ
jgi:hypothetical protein